MAGSSGNSEGSISLCFLMMEDNKNSRESKWYSKEIIDARIFLVKDRNFCRLTYHNVNYSLPYPSLHQATVRILQFKGTTKDWLYGRCRGSIAVLKID